jgi:asparagine synthase (glutamine-hydrolysing)
VCGIAGFWDRSASTTADTLQRISLQMATALKHRGPDDQGVWSDAEVGLALCHRRLSVVDLSLLGHQPMISASGRFVIVYNGEIYNFRSLRQELESHGHSFRGHSDTEVMLAAMTQWGVHDSLARFNGMFAFALWDRQSRTLYLARDRFGEKPLYYGWVRNRLIFASELKAFRSHPEFKGTIDRDALASYMRHGYVPTPHCIYRDVYKLPAGTFACWTQTSTTTPHPQSYWSAAEVALRAMRNEYRGTVEEAVRDLDSLLGDAVGLRLEADVPLGAFLSGGIDSSAIVLMMQRRNAGPVRTFTVGFEEAAYDEAAHARMIANCLGTHHTELYVTAAEAMAVIPNLPSLYDEPFADSSQIPTFLISALARQHVTVSLSGDGGDELLAGYNRYVSGFGFIQFLFRTPARLRQLIGRSLLSVRPRLVEGLSRLLVRAGGGSVVQRHPGRKLHRLGRALLTANGDPYDALMAVWNSPTEFVLQSADTSPDHRPAPDPDIGPVEMMMIRDAVTYLPDDILVKVDRASMGISLETRVPFLDPRVAEFCWALPLPMKVRNGERKWLLRETLKRHLPSHLLERPKSGFVAPVGEWLRGPLKTWAQDLLSDSTIRSQGYLEPKSVAEAWTTHLSDREDLQDRLWCVLMFQSWLNDQQQRSMALQSE